MVDRFGRAAALGLALVLPARAARPPPPALPQAQELPAAPLPPASSPQERAPTPAGKDLFEYDFESERDLEDFEPLSGAWSVSAGSLWCTSKGAREELRWRRRLTATGSLAARLSGGGALSVVLNAGATETSVVLDRPRALVSVTAGERRLLELPFEAPASRKLEFSVAWSLETIEVQVEADEPFKLRRPSAEPIDRLSLVASHSQPRVDRLLVARAAAMGAGPADADAPALGEELRIAIERATQLLAAGDPDSAFDRLVSALPGSQQGSPPLPEPALALLQKLALRRPALLANAPLSRLAAAAKVEARDGSASLVLPLRPGWSGSAAEVRRADGAIFTVECRDPRLRVEIYRYDRKLEYWFGRDPRLVLVSGGGGPTLGRARAGEQEELHEESRFVRPFEQSALELCGARSYEYELSWPDPADPAGTRALRELFALWRGDTWRISIEGDPLSFELARDDLAWLLAGFRFAER